MFEHVSAPGGLMKHTWLGGMGAGLGLFLHCSGPEKGQSASSLERPGTFPLANPPCVPPPTPLAPATPYPGSLM